MTELSLSTKEDLDAVIKVQAILRRWIARHQFLKARLWIVKLQAIVRAWLAAKRLLELGTIENPTPNHTHQTTQ
jgi:IQ calmodulin-binding motif